MTALVTWWRSAKGTHPIADKANAALISAESAVSYYFWKNLGGRVEKTLCSIQQACAKFGEEQERIMSSDTVEKLITNAIHTAFIKYPEGDGGPHLDYEWIAPEQSSHIAKAILLDLKANGFQIVKKT